MKINSKWKISLLDMFQYLGATVIKQFSTNTNYSNQKKKGRHAKRKSKISAVFLQSYRFGLRTEIFHTEILHC